MRTILRRILFGRINPIPVVLGIFCCEEAFILCLGMDMKICYNGNWHFMPVPIEKEAYRFHGKAGYD